MENDKFPNVNLPFKRVKRPFHMPFEVFFGNRHNGLGAAAAMAAMAARRHGRRRQWQRRPRRSGCGRVGIQLSSVHRISLLIINSNTN